MPLACTHFDTGREKITLHVQDTEGDTTCAGHEFQGTAEWMKCSNPQNWRVGNPLGHHRQQL